MLSFKYIKNNFNITDTPSHSMLCFKIKNDITWALNSEIFFEWWIFLFHSSFQFCEKISLQNSQEKSQFRKKVIWYVKQHIISAFLTHSICTLAHWYIEWRWYVISSSLPDCLTIGCVCKLGLLEYIKELP